MLGEGQGDIINRYWSIVRFSFFFWQKEDKTSGFNTEMLMESSWGSVYRKGG